MQSVVLGLCIAAVAICYPPIHTDNLLEDLEHSSSAYAHSCRYSLDSLYSLCIGCLSDSPYFACVGVGVGSLF
jgi:hypothetical protein